MYGVPSKPRKWTISVQINQLQNPQKPFQGNAGKFREIQGFLSKEYRNAENSQSTEIPKFILGIQTGILDDFPWRMRTAKVDMLGTGDT